MEVPIMVPSPSGPSKIDLAPAPKPLTAEENFGDRFERFLGSITSEIMRPESILLMGAGSAAFRLARFSALARLSSSPATGFFTRGAGARANAGLVGCLAETSVLTFGHPANSDSLAEAAGSNALLLGSLRIFGAAGAALASPSNLALARQVGLFGGIRLSHWIETELEWKNPAESSSPWAESFLTWLHFNAGAAVAKGALGQSFRRWESRVETATQRLEPPFTAGKLPTQGAAWSKRFALAASAMSHRPASDLTMFSTGGGKVVLHPKLARFRFLWEKPGETTLDDVKFWSQELNADPLNPRRILHAMKILQRSENTVAKRVHPDHLRLIKQTVQDEIAKTSSKQLALVRGVIESDYEAGFPVAHGCRYLEHVAFQHPKLTMRLKAFWARRRFDSFFKRDSDGQASFRRMPQGERRQNFEDAAMLRDHPYIQRWLNFSFPSLSSASPEAIAQFREHPNSIVRHALIRRLSALGMESGNFRSWWGQAELARLRADAASGERDRVQKALELLHFYRELGVQTPNFGQLFP